MRSRWPNVARMVLVASVVAGAIAWASPGWAAAPEAPGLSEEVREIEADAARGNVGAMYLMAEFYAAGSFAPKDMAIAAQWYARAAAAGLTAGMVKLARLHLVGDGVAKDVPAAIRLFEAAAVGGDERALAEMGQRALTGDGVPRDPAAAIRWLTLAAEAGDAMAHLALSRIYEDSPGVPPDPVLAYVHYVLAWGPRPRLAFVDWDLLEGRLRQRLRPADLARARRAIAQWRADHVRPHDRERFGKDAPTSRAGLRGARG